MSFSKATRFSSSRGFILPMSLWLIAATGMIAALLSEWVSGAVSNAIAIQDRMEAQIAFANIRNEMIFAFGRRPYSFRGLEVGTLDPSESADSYDRIMNANYLSDQSIFVDGRPYVVESNDRYIVQVYDGRGLINLNTVGAPILGRLFEVLNVSQSMHETLVDTLMDYRDEDDFQRLSGAEESDYTRLGLLPPADAKLVTPWEAQRILGWGGVSELWNTQYERPIMSTCQITGFNPNTASREALTAYFPGVSLDVASAMLEHREKLPFRSIRNVGDSAGIILTSQPFVFSFMPSTCLIVDLTDQQSKERIRFSLSLLPVNETQPWQIDYVLKIPETYRGSLDRVDPSLYFPSPEEIARRTGDINRIAGL